MINLSRSHFCFCYLILTVAFNNLQVGSRLGLDVLLNGKKALALDLKHPKGVQIFKDLCKKSDVLIEPYRRGVMEKLNLGPEILMKENPRLIYARLTGFGQDGYYADRAGHDMNYVSLTGLLSLFKRKGQKPNLPANLVADFGGGGLLCAFGIVSALFARVHSKKGQVIDANMVEGTAYLGSWIYRSQSLPIWGNPPGENILDSGAHFYDTYETRDKKYMAVACIEPQFYSVLCEKLQLNPDNFSQYEDFEKKKEILTRKFLEKTQKEWCDIFDSKDACVTPVLSLKEAVEHVHNIRNKTFQVLDNNVIIPRPSPKLSETPAVSVASHPAPQPGQDTYEILRYLNYSDEEIFKLEELGVIELYKEERKSKI